MLNEKLANTLGRAIALALATAATAQAAETGQVKTMSTIRVEDSDEQGTAASGYRSERAELIENLFKIHPATQLSSPQSRFFTGATVRGFGLASTKRIDNIPSTSSYVNVDLEDKERVEILSGLSGFLYGAGNVGGTLNIEPREYHPTRLTG